MPDGVKAGAAYLDVDANLAAAKRTLDREVPKLAADASQKASKGLGSKIGGHLTAGITGSLGAISGLNLGAGITGIGAGLDALAAPAERAEAKLKATFTAAGKNINDYEDDLSHVRDRMENFGHTTADTNEALAKLTAASQDPKKAIADMALVANIAAFKHISLANAAQLVVKMHAGAGKVFKEFGINIKDAGASEKELAKASKANDTASQRLAKAKEAQARFEVQLHLKKKVTAGDYLHEIDLQHKTRDAMDVYKKAHERLEKAQKNVHSKQSDINKAMDDLSHRVKGQAGAAVSTFAGKFDVWKTKIQDVAAEWGSKLGPVLTAAGPLLLGLTGIVDALGGSLAVLLSPVTLIIVAIAALAAGAIYAYNNWQAFHDGVDIIATWFQDVLWPIIQNVVAEVVRVFSSMKDDALLIWNGLRDVVQGVINVVRGIIQTVMALIHGDWGKAWDGIKLILAGAWQVLLGIVQIGIGWIMAPIHAMATTAGDIWSWLSAGLDAVWNGILRTIGTGVNLGIDIINGLIDVANLIPGVNIGHLGHVHWGEGGGMDRPQFGQATDPRTGKKIPNSEGAPPGAQRRHGPPPGAPGGPDGPPAPPPPGAPGGPAGPPAPKTVNYTVVHNHFTPVTADQLNAQQQREERLAYAG